MPRLNKRRTKRREAFENALCLIGGSAKRFKLLELRIEQAAKRGVFSELIDSETLSEAKRIGQDLDRAQKHVRQLQQEEHA